MPLRQDDWCGGTTEKKGGEIPLKFERHSPPCGFKPHRAAHGNFPVGGGARTRSKWLRVCYLFFVVVDYFMELGVMHIGTRTVAGVCARIRPGIGARIAGVLLCGLLVDA